MSSRIQQIREIWHKDPNIRFNITTKERKEILLSQDETIIFHGNLYDIKFLNKGGGIWEVYCEKRNHKSSETRSHS